MSGTRTFASQALGAAGADEASRGEDENPDESHGGKEGELWLTEAGGVLEDGPGRLEVRDEAVSASPVRGRAPGATAEEREQVAEVRHLLGPVAHADPRITRLYYYAFRAKGFAAGGGCRNFSTFDSGLVRECSRGGSDRLPRGGGAARDRTTTPRPAYEVFKDAIAAR